MQVKINEKILSIPPYISTTWSHISALRMKGNLLSVTLTDGETISISGLTQDQINLIFSYHAAFLEKETLPSSQGSQVPVRPKFKENLGPLTEPTTLSFAFGSMDGLNTMVQHNPEQADAPDLPPEVLNKISEIAKAIIPLDDMQVPKAEPHCNCFHCQIARAISPGPTLGEVAVAALPVEDEVSDEELRFEQWSIVQTGDKLYNVINRLDDHEKYSVYLGQPVGCTCGKPGCEHILAVLKS